MISRILVYSIMIFLFYRHNDRKPETLFIFTKILLFHIIIYVDTIQVVPISIICSLN